jgi:hypothetical protein
LLVTGFADPKHTLHDELEAGRITVRKGIQRFTSDGIVFDSEESPTPVDVVVFATGYRQGVSFIDPEIVDMRYEREGNDVPLYKYIFPIHQNNYSSLGFVNFVQSATFMCAELQCRYFLQVLKGERALPSVEVQEKEMRDIRNTLCAQYMDRQQLRVQAGLSIKYYDDLAVAIGCYPSLKLLWNERPTAFWHAWLTPWQPLQYRLVGKGRLESAEKSIEELYQSRFYGVCPLTGNRRTGPRIRSGLLAPFKSVGVISALSLMALYCWLRGANLGFHIQDKLKENLRYAATDPVSHALEFGKDAEDVAQLKEAESVPTNDF